MLTHCILGMDHGGLALRPVLIGTLGALAVKFEDLGVHGPESVDYPDYAHRVAERVAAAWASAERHVFGLLVCGSGQGMAMTANRHRDVRAAVCEHALAAELARAHNNANVLCLGARLIGAGPAESALTAFVQTPYAGGRHDGRVAAIDVF